MKHNKQARTKRIISSVCHRYHFANPNTAEIIFTLLFLTLISRLLSFLGGEAKY